MNRLCKHSMIPNICEWCRNEKVSKKFDFKDHESDLLIEITVTNDRTGECLGTTVAKTFDSAEERFGGLRRYLEENKNCLICGYCNRQNCDNCEWCGTAPQEKVDESGGDGEED